MSPKHLSKIFALPAAMALVLSACPGDDSGDDGSDPTTSGTDTNTTSTTDPSTSTDPSETAESSTTDPTETAESSTTDDPDTGSTGPTGNACEEYCNNAMTNCTGDNAIYPGMDECMAACAGIPEGDPADTEGNSVWCRAYHAGDPASMDAATHCPHASASGGGVCGTPCEGYCNQALNNCTGADEAFPGEAECMSACAAFPQDGAFNATDGNSAQCRTYHASFPAAADSALHCPHASSNGGGVCGTLCEGYCNQALANCTIFGDAGECMNECMNYPEDGAWNAVDGDSVQCRTYHASFPAAADPGLHCPHADVDGGGVCG